MPLYDNRDELVQALRTFLGERPEWQSHVVPRDDDIPCLLPPAMYSFVVWAVYHELMTKEEAEHCLTALCSHLAFLEEVHRRIDAVDPC